MSDTPSNGEPKISRHSAKRRRTSSPKPAAMIPPCPGLMFRWEFSSGKKPMIDFSSYPRSHMAAEIAELIWSGLHDKTYNSKGNLEYATQALARLQDYLTEKDPGVRIQSLLDIREADIDGFDLWLHGERYEAGSSSPYARIQGLVAFLGRALDFNRAHSSIVERCRYSSKFHDAVEVTPRDAYDEFTMASLRTAARADVDRILKRLHQGEAMATRGGPPEKLGYSTPANVVWSLRERGMVTEDQFAILNKIYRRREITAPQILDHVYLSIENCVPFFILLAETTGLPIECVKELDAACIDDPTSESGFATVRYVKRRRYNDEQRFEDVVSIREQYTCGWLVRELLKVTATVRRELNLGPREGSLFIGRVGLSVQPQTVTNLATAAWLKKNPIATDTSGGKLTGLELMRIRKWHKASVQYVDRGGSVSAVNSDHSTAVFVRHYGNIPSLRPRHDAAAAAGIQEAHDVAMRPHVLTDVDEQGLSQRPSDVAHAIGATETQVREVASGEQDTWVAGCLDFTDSPFFPKGQPCGAPLYGCLDCANAVITSSKIPNLLRLAQHLAAERQRMDLEAWGQHFAFAYARIHQILEMFSSEQVKAAAAEMAEVGRDFTMTQLTHRMRRA